MAKYPIVSQRGIPSPSGGFRASLSFPGAEGDLWQQIGSLAEKGQDLVLTQHIQQAEIQYQDAVLQAETEENELADRIRNNADEDTYEAELQASLGKMNKFMPKNPLAAKQYTAWMKRQMPEWEKAVVESKQARLNDKSIAQIELLASQGELGQLRVKLDAAIKTGVIKKTNAERIWRNAVEETTEKQEEAARQAALSRELAEARQIGDALGEDRAMDYVDSLLGKIPTADVNALRTIISADHARARRDKEDHQEKIAEEINTDMIDGVIGAGEYEDKPYDITKVIRDPRLKADQAMSLLDNFKKLSTALIPDESDSDAVDRIIAATDAYAMGRTVTVGGVEQKADQKYARQVLEDNLHLLDKEDRKKFRNEIYAATDPVYSSHRSDGRGYLKATLMTEKSALGISIPAGPEEIKHYNDALVELDIKLNQWKDSGKWPDERDFYKVMKVIENKVKAPGYQVGERDMETVARQAVLGGILLNAGVVSKAKAQQIAAGDPFVFEYLQGLKRQGGFPTDGEEFVKIQLRELDDIWPELNEVSKKSAIDKILQYPTRTDTGAKLRDAYRKQK